MRNIKSKIMRNPIYHNQFMFEEVRYYLDKTVVKIIPMGVTPTNLEEYPMYITDVINGSLEEWVNDNY